MIIMIYKINPISPFTRNIKRYKNKDFGSSDPYMNLIGIDDYIEFGKKGSQDSFALVRNGEISTIAAVRITTVGDVKKTIGAKTNIRSDFTKLNLQSNCLFIDFINRNSKCNSNTKGDGQIMFDWLKSESKKMNIDIICLEADGEDAEMLANHYYERKLHFNRYSDKYQVEDWPGELIFMVYFLNGISPLLVDFQVFPMDFPINSS